MEYKKRDLNNFNIHYINTNRFKAVNIEIFFTKNFSPKDIYYSNLLCNIMVYSTKKYNTRNKYAIKKEELYSLKTYSKFGIIGATDYINFTLEFLNPKYTEDSMLEECLEFYKEIIFNPNVKGNIFDINTFELIKSNFMSKIDASNDNPSIVSELNFRKVMYEGTPTAYSTLGTRKDYEKITSEELYKFYLNLFNNYKIDIFVMGDLSKEYENITTDYLLNMFKNVKPNYDKNIEIYIKNIPTRKAIKIVDDSKFTQTHLIMGYRIKDISEYELRYVFTLYNIILGNVPNSVLFSKLRSKNSLCYSVSSSRNIYNTSLNIYSGISNVNAEKAIKLVESSIKSMTNLSTIKSLFNISLKTVNTILNDYYDDFNAIIHYYYNNEFDTIANIEERREILMKITPEELVEFAKKVHLSVTYLLKEGEK